MKLKLVAEHKKQELKNSPQWRKLRVTYIAASLIITIASVVGMQIYNTQESCATSTTTRTESGYYKSGPQNWNNSSYEYKVPVTSSKCYTRAEQDEGINPEIILLLVIILGTGYLLLPKLHYYLNPKNHGNRLS